MNNGLLNIFLYILLSLSSCGSLVGQIRSLDEFEKKDGWNAIKAEGVNLSISNDKGLKGNANPASTDPEVSCYIQQVILFDKLMATIVQELALYPIFMFFGTWAFS